MKLGIITAGSVSCARTVKKLEMRSMLQQFQGETQCCCSVVCVIWGSCKSKIDCGYRVVLSCLKAHACSLVYWEDGCKNTRDFSILYKLWSVYKLKRQGGLIYYFAACCNERLF